MNTPLIVYLSFFGGIVWLWLGALGLRRIGARRIGARPRWTNDHTIGAVTLLFLGGLCFIVSLLIAPPFLADAHLLRRFMQYLTGYHASDDE